MSQKPLSPEEVSRTLIIYARNGRSRKKAAAELGISVPAVQRRIEAARKLGLSPHPGGAWPEGMSEEEIYRRGPTPLVPDYDPYRHAKTGKEVRAELKHAGEVNAFDARLIRLQDENSTLKRELKQAVRDNLSAEKVRQEIIGVAEYSAEPPAWTVDMSQRDHSGPGTPMVLWSDWHWAEVVKPAEVGGVNAFNLTIAKARAKRLLATIIKLAFQHQVHEGYPGIVLMLGGDMISGEIHGELADTNELKSIPAIWDLFNVLIAMIAELADKFGNVFVPCVVGNHGRNTLKPRAKSRVYTSFEWLLYVMLERHFERDPRVRFYVPNDIDALIQVNSTRYLLTHGDALGVKGGDGIIGALGPIMRGKIKTAHSNAQVGRDFDHMCIGHWHQYLPLPGCIVNGSLKGYDEYARTYLRAPFQRPIQAMWYDHPRVGITKHEPIYLENLNELHARDGWVSWAHVKE